MKQFIIFLIFLILIPSCLSTQLDDQVNKELLEVAKQLNGTTIFETLKNTIDYLEETILYKEYYYSRGNTLTWYEKEGDCTDKTELSTRLLNMNGIKTKNVYGMVKTTDDYWGLHNWFEYWNGTQWINVDDPYFKRMIIYYYY